MKGLKKKRKANDQVPPNFYTNALRDGSGAYPCDYNSNPGSYPGNINSSYNQPYTSQSGLASPPRVSGRNSLGSYPDSGQHAYRSDPRYAVERELPPPPREYRHEPQRIRPHSDFIPNDSRALQYLQGGQDVYGRRNPYAHYMYPSFNLSHCSPSGSSSGFISVPPQGVHDTRSNCQRPAEQRQGHHYMTDDDSDVEYQTITAEEASRIPQDDFYAKLPKAFRRTTSDGKLKKQMVASKAPESRLREAYRDNRGNWDRFAPAGFQGLLPRKLKKR